MNLLKNTQFLKLWGNQILLQIAFNMSNFTALLLINDLTGSRFALAQFYAAMTFPAFLVGFFAGSVVDLTDRKKLMLATDAILSILFFLYALAGHNFSFIILIAFATASVSQFFTPAEAATIPLLVKGEDLHPANSLFLFTQLGSVLLGYALAGPVIELFGGLSGNGASKAFIAASLLTAIGFFLRLSFKTVQNNQPELTGSRIFNKTLTLTRELLDTLKVNRGISLPVFLLTLMEFNIGLLAILFIDYVKRYLLLPATSTSYFLIIPLVVGLIIGVSAMGKLQKRWPPGSLIFTSILTFGAILFILGSSAIILKDHQTGPVILRSLTILSAAIMGMAVVFISVNARTTLQRNTPSQMLGRVFSMVTIASSAITPVPILLVALITERVDEVFIFLVFGVALTLLGVVIKKPLKENI